VKCDFPVKREIATTVETDEAGLTMKLVTKYTGVIFRRAQEVYANSNMILLIGLGGSFLSSVVIVMVFPFCVRLFLCSMISLLFFVLILVDYLLFVQGRIVDASAVEYVNGWIHKSGIDDVFDGALNDLGLDFSLSAAANSFLQVGAQDEQTKLVCQWCGIILAIGICILFLVFMSLRRNFAMLVACFSVAAETLRKMPSLFLFPFITMGSLIVWSCLLLHTVVGTLTLDHATAVGWMRTLRFPDPDDPDNFETGQKVFMWITLFSFLWVYFMHMAVFKTTVAGAVSHWYFFRLDHDNNAGTGIGSEGYFFGRPLIYALCRVLRYHMGTMALGSFLLAVVTLARILLDYADKELKRGEDLNPVVRYLLRAAKCFLCCCGACLQWLTEYTYISVAMSGRNFCRGAKASFGLLINHPVQVGLDRFASVALQTIPGVLVPLSMVILTRILLKSWLVSGCFVAFLSYMVTRMAVGVYDVSISALFFCAITDLEKFGGKYMPEDLRDALDLPHGSAPSGMGEGIELH